MAPKVAPTAAPAVSARTQNTLEVRTEIAASCWQMFRDAPVLGHGLGGFAIDYPRYRSQREIELSSLDRQFESSVSTAHDDWLQIPVEGGLPALLLVLWGALRIGRRCLDDRPRALPLLTLAALMAVRSPLGNAPCAALALLCAGRRDTVASPGPVFRRRWDRLLFGAFAALLVLAGIGPLLLNQRFAPYQEARAHDRPGDLAALAAANTWLFADARVDHLLAQEYRNAGRRDDALAAIDRALELRPYEPAYHRLRAELLVQVGRIPEAKQTLDTAARLDPGHPELLLQHAAIYFMQRNTDAAVEVLYHDPHPALFAEVAKNCDEFARLSAARKDEAGERRWRAEACLRRALDSTGADDRQEQALANERFRLAKDTCAQAGMQKDPRVLALIALLALDAADPATADRAAANVAEPLQPWQVSALGRENAAHLRRLGSWRPLLP